MFSIYSVKHEKGGKGQKDMQWGFYVDVGRLSSGGTRTKAPLLRAGPAPLGRTGVAS